MFPGMNGIDPSKLSPQVIQEISELMRTLTPEQMMKMQSLMHNSMAGFNVSNEMMEFEKNLPSGFREKMARIMYMTNGIEVPNQAPATPAVEPKTEREARMIILKSVAGGFMQPEEALSVLFPD